MDATKEQAAVDAAQAVVDADNAKLSADMDILQTAKNDLANVININWLESLTVDEVTQINQALASDPDNKTGITLALPSATT